MPRSNLVRLAALLCVVLIPPHLLGGALGWTVVAIAVICVASAIAVLASSRALPEPTKLDGVLVAVWAWTAAQCIPLPRGVVALLSSERLDVERTRELAAVGADWIPLTLDPGRTREQVVVGAAILSAYFVGRVVAARAGRRTITTAVMASSFLMAIVAFGHELFGATAVYGVHTPELTAPRLMAPLLNNNHLGGFLVLGVPIAIGTAANATDDPTRRGFAVCAGVFCGAAAILAGSRGAAATLLVGALVTSVLVLRRLRTRLERNRATLTVVGFGAVAVGIALYLGIEPLYRDFETGDYSKLDIAARAMTVVATFPVLGIGRGAFAPVFARLEDSSYWATSPENLLVAWSAEWGVVVTIILITTLAATLNRSVRSRQPEVVAASVALAVLALHNLVDFSLEMPGVVVVAAALLGGLATTSAKVSRDTRRRRAAGAVLVVALAVTVVLGADVPANRPENLVMRLDGASRSSTEEIAGDVARDHPLDPALALWVGHAYARHGDLRTFGWLNRAMQLAPEWPSAHVLAADGLERMGAVRQSLLEVREAETRKAGSAAEIACRLVARASPELVIELAPSTASAYLERLSRCAPADRMALVDAEALTQGVEDAALHVRTGRRALRVDPPSLDAAETAATRARELAPDDPAVTTFAAEVAWQKDGPERALQMLGTEDATTEMIQLRARLAALVGNEVQKERDLGELLRRAAGRTDGLARVWAFRGRIEEEAGNDGAALTAYERAHQLNSSNNRYLQNVARAADRTGNRQRAVTARRRLCDRGVRSACVVRLNPRR